MGRRRIAEPSTPGIENINVVLRHSLRCEPSIPKNEHPPAEPSIPKIEHPLAKPSIPGIENKKTSITGIEKSNLV